MKDQLIYFQKVIENNRMSHLYLISGPKGSNKQKLAYEVAYLLVGKNNAHTKAQIYKNEMPQVYFIEPDGLSIKKEQIIQLQQEFSKTSLLGGPRVYIIKDIEKMSTSAANSLLKFMEEPENNNVYGLLLTTSIESILDTIISRAQIVHMPEIFEDTIKSEFINEGIDVELSEYLVYLTKSVDEALLLSENPNILELIRFFKDFVKTYSKINESLKLFVFENSYPIVTDRNVFQNFLDLLLAYLLDVVHFKVNQKLVFEHLKPVIIETSKMLSLETLDKIVDKVKETIMKQTYYIQLDLAMNELAIYMENQR